MVRRLALKRLDLAARASPSDHRQRGAGMLGADRGESEVIMDYRRLDGFQIMPVLLDRRASQA